MDEFAETDALFSSQDKQLTGVALPRPQKTRAAMELEAQGWRVWLKTMGPKTFTGEFAYFHRDFWEWYWPLIRAKQRGESIATRDAYLTYLLLLGRGNAKSSCMEWAAIAAGALIGPMAVVYTSATETLAVEHLGAIKTRVETQNVARYYPSLSEARVGKYGSRDGWNKSVLKTQSGLTVYAVGLNQEVRGLKDLDLRIGLEIFDDFDSRDDSPDVVKKKEGQIGGTILPMGTPETINIMGQNIIHEDSVANRIHKRHSPLLSHRKESGVIPAFINVTITPAEEGSEVHPNGRITGGQAAWQHFNIDDAQRFLDDSGEALWQAEYQHNFAAQRQGLVLSNFDDSVHTITWSEFERVFGVRSIPDKWNKYMANDWAKTKSALHANVVTHLTVSDQNTALPGRIFLFDLLTFKPKTEADDVALAMLKAMTPKVPRIGGNAVSDWDDLIKASIDRKELEQYVHNTTALIEAKHAMLAKVIKPYTHAAKMARNYKALRMSHEAKGPREVYSDVFGLEFDPINPGADGGADTVNLHMKVNHELPHPFRPHKTGDTRFFLIVDDNKIAPVKDLKPDLIHGMALARYQFAHWHELEPKLTSEGIKERGPQKMNDDVGNSLMMLFYDRLPRARELTLAEKVEQAIPQEYRYSEMAKTSPNGVGLSASQEFALAFQTAEAKKKLANSGQRRFSIDYNG